MVRIGTLECISNSRVSVPNVRVYTTIRVDDIVVACAIVQDHLVELWLPVHLELALLVDLLVQRHAHAQLKRQGKDRVLVQRTLYSILQNLLANHLPRFCIQVLELFQGIEYVGDVILDTDNQEAVEEVGGLVEDLLQEGDCLCLPGWVVVFGELNTVRVEEQEALDHEGTHDPRV